MKENYPNLTFLGFQCREKFRTSGSIRFALYSDTSCTLLDGILDIHFTLQKKQAASFLVVLERVTESHDFYRRKAAKEIQGLLEVFELPSTCAYEFLLEFASEGIVLSRHVDEEGMHHGT